MANDYFKMPPYVTQSDVRTWPEDISVNISL